MTGCASQARRLRCSTWVFLSSSILPCGSRSRTQHVSQRHGHCLVTSSSRLIQRRSFGGTHAAGEPCSHFFSPVDSLCALATAVFGRTVEGISCPYVHASSGQVRIHMFAILSSHAHVSCTCTCCHVCCTMGTQYSCQYAALVSIRCIVSDR